jgi:two-component system, chemotaxis family, sensor kinase CheA
VQYNPVETYRQEAEELLTEIEQCALTLESQPSVDKIHQLFRAFHTIKGSAAMCGMDAVAAFTHHIESLLEQVRNGKLPVCQELEALILQARDHIRMLLDAGEPPVPSLLPSGEAVIAAVKAFSGAAAAPPPQAGTLERTWRIAFQPNPAMLACGGNPSALFAELRTLGACDITVHTGDVPCLDTIQPDLCYFQWTIRLQSGCDKNAIRDVFIFVEDGSKLEIEPESDVPAPQVVSAADPVPAAKSQAREATVRVPSNRLDHLVNLVGELVMIQSRLAQAAAQSGVTELANPVQELDRLVSELRDDVLGIRMLPIGSLFGRFNRLVHDLSAELGKEADLVTEGAETELDKSILDLLSEPLVHCLRNCLDHGVESPQERLAAGKSRRSRIRLSAAHLGSDVVIGVDDDGRGIDRCAVRAKALEKQLISPDATLCDREIFNLILLPGFSTASQITSVSGRGVGMDAVRRQIDSLRGSISVSSEEGTGTRVSITVPLTLAIIEGLLVQLGDDQFIIPLASVTENVELPSAEKASRNGRNVIAVRGELIPYIGLREAFGVDGPAPDIEMVVIVRHEDHRVGLLVDRVLGTHQTVIQSLGKFFRNIEVVSGSTIMGDGRVALILDVPAVVRYANSKTGHSGKG